MYPRDSSSHVTTGSPCKPEVLRPPHRFRPHLRRSAKPSGSGSEVCLGLRPPGPLTPAFDADRFD